ncbi:hypothetical protein [Ornithinibacillus contaminans]|uniref:hypothetical protein n=1 Tax=Ornithinibacillus contaminans TaxID=694055 RepID=UPI00064DF8A6|nr:hypothetical protein [Ornithinibacillus contaminans]
MYIISILGNYFTEVILFSVVMMLRLLYFRIGILLLVWMALTGFDYRVANLEMMERIPTSLEEHNWQKSSVDYNVIEVGTHDYTYWKNFMKRTRTCHISHRIKTVVYYCDIHNHTKSETSLEEIIHSERHRLE